MIGGDRQQDYITKEDVSSPTVSAEAVMLTCVIETQEGDVAAVYIPNAFAQTVVSEDEKEHRVIACIRGPLVTFWYILHQAYTACM